MFPCRAKVVENLPKSLSLGGALFLGKFSVQFVSEPFLSMKNFLLLLGLLHYLTQAAMSNPKFPLKVIFAVSPLARKRICFSHCSNFIIVSVLPEFRLV